MKHLLPILLVCLFEAVSGQSEFKDRFNIGLGFGQLYITEEPSLINVSSSWLVNFWSEYFVSNPQNKLLVSTAIDFRQEWVITNGLFENKNWVIPNFANSASHIRNSQIGVPISLYINVNKKNLNQKIGIGYRPNYLLRSVYRFSNDQNMDSYVELTQESTRFHHDLLIQFMEKVGDSDSRFPVKSLKLMGTIGIDRWQENGYRPLSLQILIGLF